MRLHKQLSEEEPNEPTDPDFEEFEGLINPTVSPKANTRPHWDVDFEPKDPGWYYTDNSNREIYRHH